MTKAQMEAMATEDLSSYLVDITIDESQSREAQDYEYADELEAEIDIGMNILMNRGYFDAE